MTTSRYLDSVLNILPAVQAKQISDLLKDFREKGSINNTEEYNQKLSELTSLLNNPKPIPSFQYIKSIVWALCSSDAHNIMITSAKNDIESLFLQLNEITKITQDHYDYFINNLLYTLDQTIKQQETKIKELELILNKDTEFSLCQINSFNFLDSIGLPRNKNNECFFIDNRTSSLISEKEIPSAIIDENKECLSIPFTDSKILPTKVTLFSNTNSYGVIHDESLNNINNIIDGQKYTYWSSDFYVDDPVDKVSIGLNFSFDNSKDISYIVLENAGSTSLVLENIYATTSSGNKVSLLNEYITIDKTKKIDFMPINVSSISIIVSVSSYIQSNYYSTDKSNLSILSNIDGVFDKLILKDSISYIVNNSITSNNLSYICNVPKPISYQNNKYIYNISLDNVYFGLAEYKSAAIYVSQPLEINRIGTVAVSTIESTDLYNTIEYDIMKVNNDDKSTLTKIQIPRYKDSLINKERIIFILNDSDSLLKNIANTRFMPLIPFGATSISDYISVYEDDKILDISNKDWEFAISKDNNNNFIWRTSYTGLSTNSYNLLPTNFFIKIRNPKINSVYSIDYTIRTSDYVDTDNSNLQIWLDNNKTISLHEDNIIKFNSTSDISKIYLQITLRRNSPIETSIVNLSEYSLLASRYE